MPVVITEDPHEDLGSRGLRFLKIDVLSLTMAFPGWCW